MTWGPIGGGGGGGGTSSATYTVTDALILGAATTSGVRLDLESGALAVREGDDSGYVQVNAVSHASYSGATMKSRLSEAALDFASSLSIKWSSMTTAGASQDTGLARDSAGVVKVTDGSTGGGTLLSNALVLEAATTSGVRLDLESGALAVREGDDSAYAPLTCGPMNFGVSGTTYAFGTNAYVRGRIYLGPTGSEDVGLFRASTKALAIEDGTNNSATNVHQVTTLSSALTSGATYTFTGALPAGAVILGVSARITTTITGPTSVQIGDGSDADRYGEFSTLTSGQTKANAATASPLEWRSAAGDVVLTAVGGGGAFTAGAVRIVVHYLTMTAPTS